MEGKRLTKDALAEIFERMADADVADMQRHLLSLASVPGDAAEHFSLVRRGLEHGLAEESTPEGRRDFEAALGALDHLQAPVARALEMTTRPTPGRLRMVWDADAAESGPTPGSP